ncbi:MFS transporter [Pseudoalteromonas xiamenensis]
MIKTMTHFTKLTWVLLLGNFAIRTSYFMVWPFLAVILYDRYGLTAVEVGGLLSLSAVFSTSIGFFTGYLADRFGRLPILMLAIALGIIAFLGLAVMTDLVSFMAFVALATMPRALWDAPSKALMSDELPDQNHRELAYQTLYFLVNVGAAFGPLFGLWAGLNGNVGLFAFTALVYLGMGLGVLIFWSGRHQVAKSGLGVPAFSTWLSILRRDKRFLLVLAANFIVFVVFAQSDSTLVQYLARENVPDLAFLISSLIVMNGAIIVVAQFPLLAVMRNWSIENRLLVGSFLLLISQITMAAIHVNSYTGWLFAMAILSLGEAILFANLNVLLDRLSPESMKASYFGAAGLCSLGYAFAPFIGGVILQSFGGVLLFLTMAFLCLLVMVIYQFSTRFAVFTGHSESLCNT